MRLHQLVHRLVVEIAPLKDELLTDEVVGIIVQVLRLESRLYVSLQSSPILAQR